MANKLYKEKQQFNDKLTIGLIGLAILACLNGAIQTAISADGSIIQAVCYLAAASLITLLLYKLLKTKMKMSVSDKKIKVKFETLYKTSATIPWDDVESCKLIKTPLATRWHGSNISFGSAIWYSLTGRNGLSVTTKDGQEYFIGCQNVDKLKESLSNLVID